MTDGQVQFSAAGGVGRIDFDRPDHGNSLTVPMMRAFIDALRQAHAADLGVLVVGANGEDFSVGRDHGPPPPGVSRDDSVAMIVEANDLLTDFKGVTVAAVQGRALGFGCGVATQCDITLASGEARFGFNEIRGGITPWFVMTYLETYVTRKVALDLVLTGRTVSAHEAWQMGLVTQVVPDGFLEPATAATVDALRGRARDALEQSKSFLRAIQAVPVEDRNATALQHSRARAAGQATAARS